MNLYSYVVETFPFLSEIFRQHQGMASSSAAEEKEKNSMMKNLHFLSNDIYSRDSTHINWIKMKTTSVLNRYRVILGTNAHHPCSIATVKSMLSHIPPPCRSSPDKSIEDETTIRNYCIPSQANHSQQQNTESSQPHAIETTRSRTSNIYQGTEGDKHYTVTSREYLPQSKVTYCNISDTQTASRLAEGTIYSLRDLLLDEAIGSFQIKKRPRLFIVVHLCSCFFIFFFFFFVFYAFHQKN